MKKWILALAIFLPSGIAWAQSLGPTAISSGGSGGFTGSSSLDWTIGQVTYLTASSSSYHLTQGFQQPTEFVNPVVDLRPDWTITVFPNPANNQLFLSTYDIPEASKAKFELIDLNGRRLASGNISGPLHSVDVSFLPASLYFLRISDETGLSMTVKVQIQ